MSLSTEQLAELETKHRRIAQVLGKGGAWAVAYRAPRRAEYKQFRQRANNPAQKADAVEILARQCVVFPTPEAFDALLEDFPGICEASSDALMDLAGMSTEDSGK